MAHESILVLVGGPEWLEFAKDLATARVEANKSGWWDWFAVDGFKDQYGDKDILTTEEVVQYLQDDAHPSPDAIITDKGLETWGDRPGHAWRESVVKTLRVLPGELVVIANGHY